MKWDEVIEDIEEDETANLEYNDSPYEDPKFYIFITRDRYPGLVVKNITNRTIYPQVIWYAAKYDYEEVKDVELLDKLRRGIVRSYPAATRKVD